MTIAREIRALVRRLGGTSICDNCLTDRLRLSVPSQANAVTRSLAAEAGYERRRDVCGQCGKLRTIVRSCSGTD
ncbi:hypothetical protein SAMN05428974_0514 [Sphingopyxis sp. YR583]|uniref:hypothetical protein n=1 Tax=Sphingopyxis sp. YR583 TaxID=1881047 RepID=UPI0008A72E2A|nr:hypothetical protein [Sphingopyxis sp. YR583]SEH12596.1 hypothetical protein SAMN05428974_0514 [Sphingopyxis sp. YR583]